MHSLRTKITAVTVAAIVASFLTAGIAGFFTVGQEMSTSAAEKMHLMSENAQKSLDAYLNDIEQDVEITAQIARSALDSMTLVECAANKSIEKRSAEQTARLDAYLAEHVQAMKDPFGNIASHTNGVMSYYYCIVPEMSAHEHGFFFSRMGKVGFEELAPIDTGALDLTDVEHNIWYITAREKGSPTWVGPYKSTYAGDELVVSYLAPIYQSSVLVGIMSMDIMLDTMAEQIDSLKVYETGHACLLDQDGRVIYHPEYELGSIPESEARMFSADFFSKPSSGDEVVQYVKDGESWQMSYSTLSNGMKLMVTAPVSEVASPWNRLVSTVPLIGALILLLFIPLVLLATSAVTKPLQQLTSAARHLSRGDYEIELDYQGKDEVGELTDAFRNLREHLQVYTSNLSSASFSDKLTGVKNKRAFDMYAAQVNDSVVHASDGEATRFALVVIDCLDAQRIEADFGAEWADKSIQATCQLACQIYSEASVFRVGEHRFVAVLQGRNFANRDELFYDFDIWADEVNAEATEPWQQVHAAKGMATYRLHEDADVAAVLERATRRMEHA